MKNVANGISLTMTGLVLAGLGVISPIAWDWWSKQSQIVVDTVSSISIIGHSQSVKNLEFTYNGKKIAELQRTNVAVKNAGRTPVVLEDVVVPLTLAFKADEILEAKIVRQNPTNLGATVSVSRTSMAVLFSLLNPGDEIEVEVLTSGPYSGYGANARIKNIENIAIGDSSRAIAIRSDVGIGVYIAGGVGLLFLIVGIAMLLEIPVKRRVIAGLRDGSHRLLNSNSISDAERHVAADFRFLTGERKPLLDKSVAGFSWPLNQVDSDELQEQVVTIVNSEESGLPGTIAVGIACIAIWYVLSSVFA